MFDYICPLFNNLGGGGVENVSEYCSLVVVFRMTIIFDINIYHVVNRNQLRKK